MIKAVFFDIDGTLVSFKNHNVPQSTIEAIDTLHRQGIKVFVASGRHKLAINNLGNLQFDGYVTLNGGLNTIEDKLIYKHAIPAGDIQTLLNYLDGDSSFPCVFVYEDELIMNFMNDTADEIFTMLNYPEPPIGPLHKSTDKPVYQVIAFFKEDQENEIMKMLPGCETTRWNPLFTDVVPKGSSKWIGISKVIEQFGIKQDETMAFGDGGNDIEMLSNVHIGVAMGNADDNVKSHADYVTASVDDDGIMKALKHFGVL